MKILIVLLSILIPSGMRFLSSVTDQDYQLRKKIISKNVEFQTTYINLHPDLELIPSADGNENVTNTVESDDINKINNAKYYATIDLSSCTTAGQCETAKVTYRIEGKGVKMMYVNEGKSINNNSD